MCSKKPVGRPRANTIKVVVTFRLHPEADADILALLARHPRNKARAIMKALRAGMQPGDADAAENDDRLAVDDLLSHWEL
jgi:hypothetical protein